MENIKGCPQGSASDPGLWNIQYDSLLNLEYTKCTKVMTYADNLMILVKGTTQEEAKNYAYIEIQKVENGLEIIKQTLTTRNQK